MNMGMLREFFMWCTIINVALLTVSSMICCFAAGWVYRMHSKWFPIPREAFNVAIYSFVGLYKMFVLVFSVVPYIALEIML